MILYNVTVTIDLDVQEKWLKWMREEHIPDVMATGMFLSYRLGKMLDHGHEEAEIYTVQYLCRDRMTLIRYQEDFAPELQKPMRILFDGKFLVFRSLMDVVDHNEKI
jgi:hypothetical protein